VIEANKKEEEVWQQAKLLWANCANQVIKTNQTKKRSGNKQSYCGPILVLIE